MDFLADYHVHTIYSPDAEKGGSFAETLSAAESHGLSEICFTDHCDVSNPEAFPAADYYSGFRQLQAAAAKPLLGIELGDPLHDLPRAKAEIAKNPYDFILCSLHILRDELDFYFLKYSSLEDCEAKMSKYFIELLEMANWGEFDVLGHIDYPIRQMRNAGFEISLLPKYRDELCTLFSLLAYRGLGIEINLKSAPQLHGVLELYKDCGGEIITIGSDAHTPADVGKGFDLATAMLKVAGFTHVAAYEKRAVRFEKI